MNFPEIETPAVLVDIEKAETNVRRFQDYCRQHGLSVRPHIKTHKIPELARLQVDAGATGINCQKLGEAEVMADNGLDDILITYNIIGPGKLQRLRALHANPELARTMARRGHEDVRRRFDIAGMARTLFQCYREAGVGLEPTPSTR